MIHSGKSKKIIIDEIHKLKDPSELLKLGADYYPELKVIATGSSSLSASSKFRDTLTGRKFDLWLSPMNLSDMKDFSNEDIKHRLLRGGLPPFFLSDHYPELEYHEWMDSFWARDIQELFKVEKRYSFLKFIELILVDSGGIFEATRFAKSCEVSRATILNYLNILEYTYIAAIIRPFHGKKSNEIISSPKVYGFDTGFIHFFKGNLEPRNEDFGILWEHFVLNEIRSKLPNIEVNYWRDKSGHEIDFILSKRGKPPILIECKWKKKEVDTTNIVLFRKFYPEGQNFIIVPGDFESHQTKNKGVSITYSSLNNLMTILQKPLRGFAG